MDSSAWDARYADTELLWTAEPNRFVVQELADLPGGRALDLAAGEGRNAVWLAEQGWRVTAVDFSAVAVGKGRRLAASRGVAVEWLVADLLDYRPRAATFDLVLVAYLHLPPAQRRTVLAAAVDALAPGGLVLVVGHDVSNLTEGVGGPRDPDLLYEPATIAAELAGLRIVRDGRVLRPVSTSDGDRTAVDTLVRAVREDVDR